MLKKITFLWNKISRLGLRENEGVQNFREVIFLNRMLALLPLIIIAYIPLEIYLNGYSAIYVVLLMLICFMVPFPLHYFRLFRTAKYYMFLIGNILIIGAGLIAGKHVHNNVTLIPLVLLGVILFKTKSERILSFVITTAFFVAQQFMFDYVTPSLLLSEDLIFIFSTIFLFISLLMCFMIGFYFIGINREFESIVIEQRESMAIKNKEITDSITYARRIQAAILPPDSLVKSLLPNTFILYKPKDIVAGDFYWIEKSGENVLVAAADCTGHGVPGAMVSVVCNNALGRSVREFGLTEPSRILDKSREIIIHEFERSEEEVTDGMDISLCALNMKSKMMQWSGANNPLIVIRQGEIIEVKPDKQPVGKYSGATPFTNHSIQLENGDMIYLFSDGYSDQFGGPNGKKLKYKAFKQLLLRNSSLPLSEQKNKLDLALAEWQGQLEQLDDICVIGIQI